MGIFMTEEKFAEFQKELKELLKKHDVTNAAFTGTCNKKYIGLMCLTEKDAQNLSEIILTVSNVGRLWQHAKTAVKLMLDDFEGDK